MVALFWCPFPECSAAPTFKQQHAPLTYPNHILSHQEAHVNPQAYGHTTRKQQPYDEIQRTRAWIGDNDTVRVCFAVRQAEKQTPENLVPLHAAAACTERLKTTFGLNLSSATVAVIQLLCWRSWWSTVSSKNLNL